MFYGLENGTRRDDICSMCDDRLQPTKWKMSRAAFLFILKDSAQQWQVLADIKSCLPERWLTRVVNLYFTGGIKSNTLNWFGAAPFCRNIWQTSIYVQIAVEVGVVALLCWLHLSHTEAFWSFLINKIVQLNWEQDIVHCNRSTPLYRQEGLSIGIYFHTCTLAFCSPVTVKAIGFISVNCSTRTFFNYVSVCVTSLTGTDSHWPGTDSVNMRGSILTHLVGKE